MIEEIRMMIEEKEKYINPFTDFGFKKLFGTEVNNDYNNTINTAKEIAMAEGLEKGKAEGLTEGEKKKAIESAKEMLADGISIEKIAKYTGLTIAEIKTLIKQP